MANIIGDKIKAIRKQKKLTQEQLAFALGYRDKSMIAHIENGDSDMTYDKILQFVRMFKIDANELFADSIRMPKKQEVPTRIGPFKRIVSKESTMEYGYYYSLTMTLPFAKENKRTVRVWLPEDYDFDRTDKKYPVIYMSDGQNLVDARLSAFGEWKFDKTVHRLMRDGLPGIIAVGIDCPKEPLERTMELCPPYIPRPEIALRQGEELTHTYADKYINYIIYNLKPLIDKTFHTLTDKKNTGIGGSSMGGLMSSYAFLYRPDIFGYCLSFSPALFFYNPEDLYKLTETLNMKPDNGGKIFFYSGGTGFEGDFLFQTTDAYMFMREHGFKNDQLRLVVDTDAEHNEEAWAKQLEPALRFWFTDKVVPVKPFKK